MVSGFQPANMTYSMQIENGDVDDRVMQREVEEVGEQERVSGACDGNGRRNSTDRGDACLRPNGPKRGTYKRHVQMELFSEAKAQWILEYNQFSCQHDKEAVLLFRACCNHLGPHAIATGSFRGSPCYEKDRTRMMWFDTSFLVSMRKSGWGTKSAREVVLAIWVRRKFLEECLGEAVCSDTFGPPIPRGSCAGTSAGGTHSWRFRSGAGPTKSLRTRVSARKGFGGEFGSGSPAGSGDDCGDSNSPAPSREPAAQMFASPPMSPCRAHKVDRRVEAPPHAFELRDGAAVHPAAESGPRVGADAVPAANGVRRQPVFWGDGSTAFASPTGTEDDDRALEDDGVEAGTSGEGDGGAVGVSTATTRALDGRHGRSPEGRVKDAVRLHWEPERLPSGEKHCTRRVVQLGLKGKWLRRLASGEAVVKMERLDNLLHELRTVLESPEPHHLVVPVARPLDCSHLKSEQLEALHLVNQRARRKLRILCLHGYLQNAKIFSKRTRQLSKKLRHSTELVYVDAPHVLSSDELPPPITSPVTSTLARVAVASAAAAEVAAAKVVTSGEGGAPRRRNSMDEDDRYYRADKDDDDEAGDGSRRTRAASSTVPGNEEERVNARAWWKCDANERRNAKAVPGMSGRCEWQGLQDSLDYLSRIWDEQGPFDGLLGFSQGAGMASVFYHCAFGSGSRSSSGSGSSIAPAEARAEMRAPSSPPPSFAVFVSGCYQPHPTQIPSYPLQQNEGQEDLPSLHVWALEDPFVPASHSQRLAGMYFRASVVMHRGSHFVPQNRDMMPHFIRFLEEFR